MVRVRIGDIFESQAQTLVNTVNCTGVMGRGIALEFRRRFPEMYKDYLSRCQAREVRLGEPYLFRRAAAPWILNFPTKEHWRSVSRVKDIASGMEYLVGHYRDWGITSLAMPPLGCGQGQLEWRIVGPTLYYYLDRLEIPTELYAPYGTPREELQRNFFNQGLDRVWASGPNPPDRLSAAWVALVEILSQIEREPYHWPVGRTTFQKIAYFATQAGVPTGLIHERGSFGPYASQLKLLITRLVDHDLIREERQGQMFRVRVGASWEAARESYKADLEQWRGILERVADLFMRMRTQQAETAATVHFAAVSLAERKRQKPTERDVLQEVLRWKHGRRPPLDEHEVALAVRNLGMLNWLDVKPSEDLPIREESLVP